MIWTSMVVVFVLMRFSASCKCSFEILKAETADLSPAGSDIFLLRATLKFTRAKESWFGVVEALEDGSWMENQALNYRRGPKIVNFLSFWSVFPNLRLLGPPDGSHRSPWPNLLFSDTKFQYLVTKSFSWNISENINKKLIFWLFSDILAIWWPSTDPWSTRRCPSCEFFLSHIRLLNDLGTRPAQGFLPICWEKVKNTR